MKHFLDLLLKKAPDHLTGIVLLMLRLFVAQEFFMAGYKKVNSGLTAPEWFSSLSFPFPFNILSADLNWILAGFGELLFATGLILGLMTRLSALSLLLVTYVAVYTVHFDLSWSGWNQIETEQGLGFKVPLMLAIMLFVILIQGAGRYALDHIIDHFCKHKNMK